MTKIIGNNTYPVFDYWRRAGMERYSGRSVEDVGRDMSKIFKASPALSILVLFGLRLITRVPKGPHDLGIDEVQYGYGLADEFNKGFNWLIDHHPNLVQSNLSQVPIFGCWKDFFSPPLVYRGGNYKFDVIRLVLKNKRDPLLMKYLPTIYSTNKKRRNRAGELKIRRSTREAIAKVRIAKAICRYARLSIFDYRDWKRRGTAHAWQRAVARGDWSGVSIEQMGARALAAAITNERDGEGNFFVRHGLREDLERWAAEHADTRLAHRPDVLAKLKHAEPVDTRLPVGSSMADMYSWLSQPIFGLIKT